MRIEDVEGIGPQDGAALRAANIQTTDDLLREGASRQGRERLAAASGLSPKLLLEWVNHVDLMRLNGVGSEFADLLEAAGVDSPAELARRNAQNLEQTFQELDAARPNVVRRVPNRAMIEGWIAEAKQLEHTIEH